MASGLKHTSLCSLFAYLLLTPSLCLAKSSLENRVILIDPGHGVINFKGRIINPGQENKLGHKEHRLTMAIGKRLGEILEKEGAKVYYTRTSRDYWRHAYNTIEDNETRAYFANEIGCEVYLSIHCDWHPSPKTQGVTTYYAKSHSKKLGEHVHRSLITSLKAKNRKLVLDTYTVLDKTDMPALIIETGFLSNRIEARKLASAAYQLKIAQAIAKGLKNYFSN